METHMEEKLKKAAEEIIRKQFPEMIGVEPDISIDTGKKRTIGTRNMPEGEFVYRRTLQSQNGFKFRRVVRITVDEEGVKRVLVSK